MTRRCLVLVPILWLGYTLTAAIPASAQAVEYSCPYFFSNVFQATDCMEAVFSEDMPYVHGHLTMGSVPPGNGFALGAVIEKPTHFVSSFAPWVLPDMRDKHEDIFRLPADPDSKDTNKTDPGGYKSLLVPKLGADISTNGSWILSGTADWLPGFYKPWTRSEKPPKPNLPPIKKPCHKFLAFCTESVLAVHFEGAHSVARTISYYGLGPATPDVKYTYRFDQTYGGVEARLPLVDAFIVSGGVEGRYPVLPVAESGSIIANFPPVALPGLNAQPTYVHSNVGFISRTRHLSEPTIPGDTENGPLHLVHRDAISPDAEFAYHWYNAGSSGPSFQQLVASAKLSIEIGATTEGYINSKDPKAKGFWHQTFYRVLEHYCGGPPADPRILVDPKADAKKKAADKKQQEEEWKKQGYSFEIKHLSLCDFGTLDLKSHLVTSTTAAGTVIPFYMMPTLGGQDIDSLVSLRGFENYRFRAPDAMFVQAEYSFPVYDPFALLLFYDAGNVGNTLGDLSFAHLRQDAGFGVNLRTMRMTILQGYFAGGRSGGLHPGFNLAKQF